MKQCTRCKKTKKINEFYTKTCSKDGYQSLCKKCMNLGSKSRYQHNPQVKINTKINAKSSINKLRNICNIIKTRYKCCFCHESNPVCLDFHHLDSTQKETGISHLISLKSKLRLIIEINKCIVVCANCHRRIHFGELDSTNKTPCNIQITEFFIQTGKKWRFK